VTVETPTRGSDTKRRPALATLRPANFSSPKERAVRAILLALILSASALSHATELSEPLILVAKPELRDNVYGGGILVVRPLGDDGHVGFIVNRPTGVSLGELFPGHDQSRTVADPVYLGGPLGAQVIFALVQRPDTPGGKSLEILPGLFVVLDEATVDHVIETEPDHARIVTGLVVWRAGELAAEVEQGAWFVLEPEAALALRKPEGLWEELVHRSRGAKLAI